jgi:hypothetical protein
MKYSYIIKIITSILLLSNISYAAGTGYALSEKEEAALELGKQMAFELAKKLNESGDPQKLEALNLMTEMSLIQAFLVSRTLVVPVSHCQKTPQGEELKKSYDQWINVAKDDLRNGYEVIKNGYHGKSYDEMNKGTIEKIMQLESEYSDLDEDELVEKCTEVGKMISSFMYGYE